jgi:hypothetical protein
LVLQVPVVLAILAASALARTAEYQHAIEKRGISGYGGGEWVSGGGDDGGHDEQEVKVIKIPVPKAVPVPVQHPVPVPVPQPYPVHIKVKGNLDRVGLYCAGVTCKNCSVISRHAHLKIQSVPHREHTPRLHDNDQQVIAVWGKHALFLVRTIRNTHIYLVRKMKCSGGTYSCRCELNI